ncbi:hypothetical protein MKL29_10455 [Streptococcus suis]|nr:hypothetical protein [Streptococcus suis]
MTRQYYQKEFSRIYDRFCFNLRLFGGDKNLRASCYREALMAIDKVKAKAIANKEINVSIAQMRLRTIKNLEMIYGKVG